MKTLLVATRKGLFVIEGQGAEWQIVAHHFVGEPVTQVLADPRTGSWYVALRLGHFGVKLKKTQDKGGSWEEIAAPAFPPKPEHTPDDTMPWNVDLIWALSAGGNDEPGTLWAGCIPAGLFKSDDGGDSWSLNDPLWQQPGRQGWFGGGYDHAGIHSILVDPHNAKHLTLGISCGGVWQSQDGGEHWQLSAAGMRADYMPAESADEQNTQDPHCLVQCVNAPDVMWAQHHCGIYRSTDGAKHWDAITAAAPSRFGFAVAADPHNPQRAWFVPAASDAHRIPVDGALVVMRTDDGGKSFSCFGDGLPKHHAYHLIYRHALDVASDGNTLAMASTTGGLWLSANAGETWQCVSKDLPPVAAVRFAA